MLKRISTLLAVVLFIGCASAQKNDPKPQCLKLSLVGTPLTEYRKEAQVINTLKVFNNRLYIGYGNWTVNTGPTDIIYYDLAQNKFVKEFTVDEEAIIAYRVLDGKLVVTGTDAMEPWDFGNVYVQTDRGWVKHRSIPNAIHIFDASSYKGKWYAATGVSRKISPDQTITPGAVFASADQGKTWATEFETPITGTDMARITSIVAFKDNLYAFSCSYSLKTGPLLDPYGEIDAFVRKSGNWQAVDLVPAKNIYCTNAYVFKDNLLLSSIVRDERTNIRASLLYSYDGASAEKLFALPIGDVVVKEDRLLMTVFDAKNRQYRIAETQDLKNWTYYILPFYNIKENAQAQPELFGVGWPKIEYNQGVFYIGTPDGNIFKSTEME